jgi:hypothetical protein
LRVPEVNSRSSTEPEGGWTNMDYDPSAAERTKEPGCG